MKSIFNLLAVILISSFSACGPGISENEQNEGTTPEVTINPDLTVVKEGNTFVIKRYHTSLKLVAPSDWDFGISPQKDRAVIGAPCDSGELCPLMFISITKDSLKAPMAQRLNNLKQEIYLRADSAQIINEIQDYTVGGKPAFVLDYAYTFEENRISGTYVTVNRNDTEELSFSILAPGYEGESYKKYWERVIVPVLKSVIIE